MYENYINVVRENLLLQKYELNFKSNENYTQILEHVSFKFGCEYLELIKNEFSDYFYKNKKHLLDLCMKNDMYGKTIKSNFDYFCVCSPSNLRYIYHSLLILSYIKSKSLNNINFVEIGGGYGGLCFFIHNLSKLFDISISSYTMFDLPDVCKLQKKYLDIFDIKVNTYHLDDNFELSKDSFLISNYALSEISKDLQLKYKKNLLDPFISCGFLVWNSDLYFKFIENNEKNILIKTETERPLTGPLNFFVYISS